MTWGCEWRHAPEARGGFGGFWRKLVELSLAVRRRRLTFASSQWPCGGCHTCWGGTDGKVIIERLCISLPYVDTFNSKVIKGFVPKLRSCKCFSCFGIPMFYVYVIYTNIMNVLRTGMNMSISRIHIWLCNSSSVFSSNIKCLKVQKKR